MWTTWWPHLYLTGLTQVCPPVRGILSTSHPNQQSCVSTPLWPIFNSGIYRAVSGTDHQCNLATSGLRGIIPTGLTKLSLQANLCLFELWKHKLLAHQVKCWTRYNRRSCWRLVLMLWPSSWESILKLDSRSIFLVSQCSVQLIFRGTHLVKFIWYWFIISQ